MRAASILAVVAAQCAAAATGCALDDPPEVPSWQVDVMPVIAANCVRCHGYPQFEDVPFGSRFDAYGPTLIPGELTDQVAGAGELAVDMARRTDPDFQSNLIARMPLERVLDDRSYQILRNWAGNADAVTNIAARGPGRLDNHTPDIVFEEVGRAAGVLTFAFDVTDLDSDLVTGVVLGPVLDDQSQIITATVGVVVSGRQTFDWDTTDVPAGSYDLVVRLDDGADIDGPDGDEDYVEIPLMMVTLP